YSWDCPHPVVSDGKDGRMQPEPLIALVCVVALAWWLTRLRDRRNRVRIEEAVSAIGGSVEFIQRHRILDSRSTSHYKVSYVDSQGRRHEGVCATNLLGGVRWHD